MSAACGIDPKKVPGEPQKQKREKEKTDKQK
jgi:hypothetical protein